MSRITELSMKFLYNVGASSETYFLFHFNIILSSNMHKGCLGQMQTAKAVIRLHRADCTFVQSDQSRCCLHISCMDIKNL